MDEASDKVVVLTALPLEYQAVRSLLESPRRIDHAGTIFERGRLSGTSCTVYLTSTGPGNDSAAVITERAVSFVQPRAVLFTGIAGALKEDISPGDVVVATEVYAYHGGKQDPEGFKARPRSWEATYSLQQVAQYVANVGAWRNKLPEKARTSTAVHFKPIVAGDVVLNAPQKSPLRVFLDQYYNGAVAVEMEGAGFASAAHKAQAVPHLMIRGISDRADGTKQNTDGAGMQEAAAQHAALFMAEVIAQLTPADASSDPKSPAAPQRPTDELTWQPLDQPAEVSWRKDLVPGSAYTSGPSLLELHLVPVPVANRVPAVRMQKLAAELVDLGRSEGFFTSLERVEAHESAEMVVVSVTDPRGRSAGLAITRSGQRSAWESLPHPGLTYVLDKEQARERITALLTLLMAVDGPTAPSYAPAAAIENTRLVTVERLSEVNPHSASLRTTDAPIEALPEEAVTAAVIASRGPELAEELTARLIYSFRTPRIRH
ncbi:5'-methylthioadenosine/S-adenosylhomocysteine nucleosidase family protein [Streptomyces tunisiensis]|uniref:5'-methylthioadenosine/S-adenosylhomocysteine nucleosidase family protein n=1 Tax=Streptomyces tunisiensis TaxID=948699 RepID=UPI003EE333D3